MSGISLCSKCHRYNTEPKDFQKNLSKGCDDKGFYKAVIECQCGAKVITGGESTSMYDEQGIMMFSHKYKGDENLDHYSAVMLETCSDDDPEKVGTILHNFAGINPSSVFGKYRRAVSLKPGEPKYIPRNLSSNCKNDDQNGIRWCITGSIEGFGSGILEWCQSFDDAFYVYVEMLHFTTEDKINIDIYGLTETYTDCFGEKQTHYGAKYNGFCNGDKIVYLQKLKSIYDDRGYIDSQSMSHSYGTIIGVIDDYKKPKKLVIRLISRRVCYGGELFDKIICVDIDDPGLFVIKRNAKAVMPNNGFRAWWLLNCNVRCLTKCPTCEHPEIKYFKDLRINLPLRKVNIKLISEMENNLKPKKFKEWLRKNVNKVLLKEALE